MKIYNHKKIKKLLPICAWLFLLFAYPLLASSFYKVEGAYKTENYKVTVSWNDVYNVKPTPLHYIFSQVRVDFSETYQRIGQGANCTVSLDGKKTLLKSDFVDIKNTKIREFWLECNTKSKVNKSMFSFKHKFRVTQPALKKGDPFHWPLKLEKAE